MEKPLNGLRVLELAGVLAGPSAGMFLAELGAEVIKIENTRSGGDVTRQWKSKGEDSSSRISAYYASVNIGKQVVFLDFRSERDLTICKKMALETDVLIMNFRSGRAAELGLDYESLKKKNKKLIHSSVTGFPDSDRVAYDLVLQAEAGFMSMNGEAEGSPLKFPIAIVDILAAHQLKEAILLALLKRERTGEGTCIEVNLFQAAVASLANQASNYLHTGIVPEKIGSLHPNIAPYGELFRTRDNKMLVLAIGSDDQFRKFSKWMEADWHNQTEFSGNIQRIKHRVELKELIGQHLHQRSSIDIARDLDKLGIPYGIVRNLEEVLSEESAKKLIIEEIAESGEMLRAVRSVAFKMH